MSFPTMRGSNVLIRIIQQKAQKIGAIEISGRLDKEMDEVEILGVGPGDITASARSNTFDLKPGQRCIAHMRMSRPKPGGGEVYQEKRVPFVYKNETLSIIDQSQVILILNDATDLIH